MELINTYFSELSDSQIDQFERMLPLYEEWNAKINVISRKNMESFYTHHVLHSLSIVKLAPLDNYKTVLDIGTGGGFPGIPLAIYYPQIKFTLVDSIAKKIKVVNEIASALGLNNVETEVNRFENIQKPFPCIVSRAVAPAIKLVTMTKNALQPKGTHIFLKGGDLTVEREELISQFPHKTWNSMPIASVFEDSFFETKKLIVLS